MEEPGTVPCLTVPELALAWLAGTEPTDRALAGWCPQSYVQMLYGEFLRKYEERRELAGS